MKFCHVTFSVNNLDESVSFYKDIIGLPLNRRFTAGDGLEIAFMGGGETELELIWGKADKEINTGQGISLGFEVASLEETIEFLSQKGIVSGDIVQLGTQAKCVFISDPSGMRVQLIEYSKL